MFEEGEGSKGEGDRALYRVDAIGVGNDICGAIHDVDVVAGAAIEAVDSSAAIEGVVASAAIKDVVARTAIEAVVAGAAKEPIVAFIGLKPIVAGAAIQQVIPVAAGDRVVPIACGDEQRTRIDTRHSAGGPADKQIVCCSTAQHGVAQGGQVAGELWAQG